ncbi:MAG: PilW family protein [Deltaproteobacteria bacterium]|nr:PilW family protein [Deltaproteobacteria bacterium]
MTKGQKKFTSLNYVNEVSICGISRKLNTELVKVLNTKEGNVTGFTLIELIVALVIGSLMMIALMATFILQSKAYTATRLSSQIQNNARTAIDTIDTMVSMAGFGVVKSNLSPLNQIQNPAFTYDSAAFYFPDYTNPGNLGYNSGQDNFTNSTMDGTDCVNKGFAPQNQGGPCPPYGTDSLTFAFRDPQHQGTINSVSISPYQISFTDNYPYFGLQPGDVLFLIDPNHVYSALVTNTSTITASQGAQTANISSVSGGSAGFYNELTTLTKDLSNNPSLFNGGYLEKVNVVHVYVDYSDANHPMLMMIINGSSPIPLAEDIEDFQVQFVMDDSNLATGYNVMGSYSSQYQSTYSDYPSFSNFFYDPTQANNPHQNPYNINAIIITIVARSDVPSISVATPPLPMVADHNTGTGSGTALSYPTPTLGALANYQRQIYQRIIQLPNIRTESKLYDNGIL